MERLIFGAVADDDTGASDLAGMLAERGVHTLQVIDLPEAAQFLEWSRGYQAVVMAEGTRNLPPAAARTRTRQALQLLKLRDPRMVEIKYCSTFDSTPEGNIGPTIDAALDELQEEFTITLPALPVNGRTTYLGHHFVYGQLLSDSPMRHHPLNPMTNANLVEWLGLQTQRQIGLAAFVDVQAGPQALQSRLAALRDAGASVAVVDCLTDAHVATVCRATADLRLVTGSSAFGMELPTIWRERGWLPAKANPGMKFFPENRDAGCLIVAGSCSQATRQQNGRFVAQGGQALRLDPYELLDSRSYGQQLCTQVMEILRREEHCLLFSSDEPEQVRAVQQWGAQRGWSVSQTGAALATAMANLTAEILPSHSIGGLIVAGGETSSAACRALKLGALHIVKNIIPGVPLCFSLGEFRLPVVLKSGNFGGANFYAQALAAIKSAPAFFG